VVLGPLGFGPSENGTERKIDNLSCAKYLFASVSLDFKT
jgi:hypothetical protein